MTVRRSLSPEEELVEHLRRLQREGVWGLEVAGRDGVDGGDGAPGRADDADRRPVASRDDPTRGSDAGHGADRGRSREEETKKGMVMTEGDDDRDGSRPDTLFGSAGIGLPPSDEELGEIAEEAVGCTLCRLCEDRTQVVFGVGDPDADLVFIGEAPGREEDRRGEPFVGRAGKLLDKIIRAMGLTRDQVYITNANKCRPPENRDPRPDEIEACKPYLDRQLAVIRPEAVVLLGRTAVQSVLGRTDALSRLRGRFLDLYGIPVMCTYHPAYLLRNPNAKQYVWEDMQQVMELLGIPIE